MTGVPRRFLQEVREHPPQVRVVILVDTGTDGVEIGRGDDSVDAGPCAAVAIDRPLKGVVRTDVVVNKLRFDRLAGEAFEYPQRLSVRRCLDEPEERCTVGTGERRPSSSLTPSTFRTIDSRLILQQGDESRPIVADRTRRLAIGHSRPARCRRVLLFWSLRVGT